MCGIAGILSREVAIDKKAICHHMTEALAHRGPDHLEVYADDLLALGHARLSILDLREAANQPFWDREKNFCVVFNGEIYNHLELRKELPEQHFDTSSDTESLLYAWKKWGSACIDKLEGMFAFAIYDVRAQELFLVRDRLGIKPLYYHAGDRAFVFSSELRSLAKSALFKKEMNPGAALEMLQYQAVVSYEAILKDVQLLPPACMLRITESDVSLHEYWKPTEGGVYDIGFEEAKSRVKDLLFEAVEKRLLADVPLGAFLSGGIDSSAIVAIMSQLRESPVSSFSVTFDEAEFSEKKYSDMLAAKYGTRHQEVRLKAEDFLGMIPEALQAMDHPSADGINTYVVSKFTKEAGLTVALSGLGGDEIFLGYPLFSQMEQLNNKRWLYSFPRWMRRMGASALSDKTLAGQKKQAVLSAESFDLSHVYPELRKVFPTSEMASISSQGIGETYPMSLFSEYTENYNIPLQSKLSVLELKGYMHSVLLKDTDQMSMAHALEVRVPFLDHKLVEFVLRLPASYKWGASPKNLLVESLGTLLPPELVNRPKMGFVLPWEKWLKAELKDFAEEEIQQLEAVNYLNFERILHIWKSFQNNEGKYSWSRVWPFVVLGHSMRKYGT